jgi:hypothetical protein
MTEDQERRFRQVCEQAYRRNDMQMLEALRYIRDGATYGESRKTRGVNHD